MKRPQRVLISSLCFPEVYSKAKMEAIDPQGMDLTAWVAGQETPIRIEFERTLKDSEDAHQTLISMVKQARKSTV